MRFPNRKLILCHLLSFGICVQVTTAQNRSWDTIPSPVRKTIDFIQFGPLHKHNWNPNDDTTTLILDLINRTNPALDTIIDSLLKSSVNKYSYNFKSQMKDRCYALITLAYLKDSSNGLPPKMKSMDIALNKFMASDGQTSIFELYDSGSVLKGEHFGMYTLRERRKIFGIFTVMKKAKSTPINTFGMLKTKEITIQAENVHRCNIFVDDHYTDTSDNVIRFPPGIYRIRLEKQGYYPSLNSINIPEDDDFSPKTIVFKMKKS